jgi:hypothetical protein
MQNIRGGYKKNMDKKVQKDMSLNGGCMTCPKGKKKLDVYFRTLVLLMPKLYKGYKSNSTSRPAVKKVTSRPVVKKVTSRPVVKKVTSRPAVKKVTSRPVVKKVTTRPVVKKVTTRPVAKRIDNKKKVRGGDKFMDNVLNTSWLSFKKHEYVPENLNNQIASLESTIF